MRVFIDTNIIISAILSDSDILLTGDKDFYEINIQKPLIMSPTKYYELISNGNEV